jgi:class 3 adenylate cyclase
MNDKVKNKLYFAHPKITSDYATQLSWLSNLNSMLPSQSILKQISEMSKTFSVLNIDDYTRLAKSIHAIKLPDFSAFQTKSFTTVDTEQIKKLTESYNTSLHIIKNDKPEPSTFKSMVEAAKELESALNLPFLKNRIHGKAFTAINEKKYGLQNGFSSISDDNAVVVAIDIRRSTELMLKAKDPFSFGSFISGLTDQLKKCIIDNLGVFDKFTGDGLLAYFPDFYSGTNSITHALKATTECHTIFQEYYKTNRNLFSTVLIDTGLGIGVDYGKINIVTVNSELTIVGVPVVYACRLSSAPANATYINQTAYDKIVELGSSVTFSEETLEIKHEGRISIYQLKTFESKDLKLPEWFEPKK